MEGGRNEEDFMQQQDRQQRPRPPEMQHGGGARHDLHQAPPPPPRCPRCDSSNTKFCYYNNYSLSQPRYYCKACRRYWTHGGTLRNVPVGGGCRKSKRPRISSPPPSSLSSRGLVPRAQNLGGGIPGQPSRAAAPPPGGPFFAGGSFLSSMAAMQSMPAVGINREASAMGGGGRFGANMALLQGMAFQALKSPAAPPQQSRPQTTHLFPPPQSLIPPGPFCSWTQSVANSDATSSSAAPAGDRWNSNSAAAGDRAGSSFTPNQWSDCNPGVNPSQ